MAKAKQPDVAAMIANMLDGKEWSVETLDEIAEVLRAAGYQVRDADGQCEACASGESTYCGSFCEDCLEKHCEECDVCAKDFA